MDLECGQRRTTPDKMGIFWRLNTVPIAKMDMKGRMLLPIGMRYKLDLNYDDKFAIDDLGDGTIILKKIDPQRSIEILENAG